MFSLCLVFSLCLDCSFHILFGSKCACMPSEMFVQEGGDEEEAVVVERSASELELDAPPTLRARIHQSIRVQLCRQPLVRIACQHIQKATCIASMVCKSNRTIANTSSPLPVSLFCSCESTSPSLAHFSFSLLVVTLKNLLFGRCPLKNVKFS